MKNNVKRVSIKTLKWYQRSDIKIKVTQSYSHDINLFRMSRKKLSKKLKA